MNELKEIFDLIMSKVDKEHEEVGSEGSTLLSDQKSIYAAKLLLEVAREIHDKLYPNEKS